MKTTLFSVLLCLITGITCAQKDELTRVYLSPQRIVWKSNESLISNENILFKQGNSQSEVGKREMCSMTSTETDTASILLDYGKEIHGGLQIVTGSSVKGRPLLRIRFGESVGECNSELTTGGWKVGYSTNDHAKRDFIIDVPSDGSIELGNTGFRFVRIDFLRKGATMHLKEARAVFRYRDIPYLGSFKSNDERLNQIWMTGAYTVHLNMQEFLWDGIKRDRLIWLGDMHPEVATIAKVFGYNEVVPKTLDLACEQYPLPNWMNGIGSYSMWYLIIHNEWYQQNGNLDFLKKHKPYILGLIDLVDTKIDKNGNEDIGKWKFLDWPSSPDSVGVAAGYRALIAWGMQDAEKLCKILNEPEYAKKAKACADRINLQKKDHNKLKQAASIMAIAGILDPKKACDEVISVGGAKGFSTFYGYYMLQAQAMAGEYQEAIDIIRQFWGGMLDMGATTFWEDFNMDWLENAARLDEITPPGKKDIHGDFGAYCYAGFRHSLCHGWSSGPTAWMTEHILGVKIMEPGCKVIKIEPHLGDLKWVEGTFPTPYGIVKIKHVKNSDGSISSQIDAPKEIIIIKNDESGIRIAKFKGDKNCAISYTFDDGMAEHYSLAAPELEKNGFRGTFWVNGISVNANAGRVSWNQLQKMTAKGHEISNHGWSHANLVKSSPAEVKVEIEKNDSIILANLGVPAVTFCYAYNAFNKDVLDMAAKNRVGTRTQQYGMGTKSTPEQLDQWVNKLISTRDWGVAMIHGITCGYDSFPDPTILWNHYSKVKELNNLIWVGTFREVAAYTKEQENIQYKTEKLKDGIRITPDLSLDKKLFNETLTMVIDRPGIKKITISQGKKKLQAQILQEKVLFDFDPYGGAIDIKF